MNYIIRLRDKDKEHIMGGKARAIAQLKQAKFLIPDGFVLSSAAFEASLAPEQIKAIKAEINEAEIQNFITTIQPIEAVKKELRKALSELCPNGELVAVRSSASDEDGLQHSFAGQLDSFLGVPLEEVADKVAAVWRSQFSSRVLRYRREKGLPLIPPPPSVLIQHMVNPTTAGVAFGCDPVTGRRGVAVVSAVYGLGTSLVSGESDADTYHLDRNASIIQRQIAEKKLAHRLHRESGIESVEVSPDMAQKPALEDEEIRAIAALVRRVGRHFDRPQDIEWAIADGKLYLLQSRPITTLTQIADPDGVFNLWDNSNIAESYNGVTTPLTFSFARKAYEEVYRQFCRFMGVPPATIARNNDIFIRTIGLIQGRVYYNLLSWYRILALLPGFTVNRRFMEQMMGVRESLPESIIAELQNATWRSRLQDSWRLLTTVVGLVKNYFFLPRRIRLFYQRLDEALHLPQATSLRRDKPNPPYPPSLRGNGGEIPHKPNPLYPPSLRGNGGEIPHKPNPPYPPSLLGNEGEIPHKPNPPYPPSLLGNGGEIPHKPNPPYPPSLRGNGGEIPHKPNPPYPPSLLGNGGEIPPPLAGEGVGGEVNLEEWRSDELAIYYRNIERQLLTRWDAPLINDFFAMIFYGVLRRLTEKWLGDGAQTLQNDLISGEGGIISAEPAHRMRKMAEIASQNDEFIKVLCDSFLDDILQEMEKLPQFKSPYLEYLDKFGDRCLEELKLESPTLDDDPLPLLRAVGQLAKSATNYVETRMPLSLQPRKAAEKRVQNALKGHLLRKLIFNWVLKNAREKVRDRENLRFERTRVFGRARRVFVELGRRFYALDLLQSPRDIFYLEVNEILGFIEGTATCTDLKGLVAVRQAEFARYREMPAPGDRFETHGIVYRGLGIGNWGLGIGKLDKESIPSPQSSANSYLQGIGCSPGIVRGAVRVIADPKQILGAGGVPLEPGTILVAERTDPGWILLFPAAAGLLVERGSLLSHAAIVSRELGIPAIVSLPGVTHWLKDGDRVELDGSTGRVCKIKIPD